jgi:hypothetical protein
MIKKNPSTEPSTTPSRRCYREGFASFPLATPLDPANGFTMVVFFLDGSTLVDQPFVLFPAPILEHKGTVQKQDVENGGNSHFNSYT